MTVDIHIDLLLYIVGKTPGETPTEGAPSSNLRGIGEIFG